MRVRKLLLVLSLVPVLCVYALATTWLYTCTELWKARVTYGAYPTPEEGMSALLWQGQHEIEPQYIKYSDPSCVVVCRPYVWYVHVAGSGRGGGAYFLHTQDGWVHMQEDANPELVGVGMWLFGLTPRS